MTTTKLDNKTETIILCLSKRMANVNVDQQDLSQEAYLAAYNALERYNGSVELATFMYPVILGAMRDYIYRFNNAVRHKNREFVEMAPNTVLRGDSVVSLWETLGDEENPLKPFVGEIKELLTKEEQAILDYLLYYTDNITEIQKALNMTRRHVELHKANMFSKVKEWYLTEYV